MTTRMILFFVFVTLVWGVGHYYVGRRVIRDAQWPKTRPQARRLAWVGVVLLAILPITTMIVSRVGMSAPFYDQLQWVGWIAMGLSSVLVILLITADVGRAVAGLVRRVMLSPSPGSLDSPQRRGFFSRVANGAAVLGATTVGGVGVAKASGDPELVEVDVPIVGLPQALDGYRIVQLSDIHVGPTIRRDRLRSLVALANGLKPDLIAVTGDLIDGYVDELHEHVAPLADLKARDGTYFVTGNHEYYWDGLKWCEEVASLGLEVLNNEHRVIEVASAGTEGAVARILLAGVTDHRAGDHVAEHASDPAKARLGAPDCDVSVLLAHQPRSIYEAARAGYDLQISGHTHGGQYFPMTWLVHLAQPYVAGLHLHASTWIYVSRGTGYWGPPMRLGAPHEITLLRLRSA